jgi:hypothetical protein
MKYIEAPNQIKIEEPEKSIFLAGSITGAWNWQEEIMRKLIGTLNVVNPRREIFNVFDKNVEKEQISWEFHKLREVKNVLFWFSHETLAPITLFEYGSALERYLKGDLTNIFVGIHPDYQRKNDVIIQTELNAPELLKNFTSSIDDLSKIILDHFSK